MEALTRMPFTAQKKIFKRLAELADSRCLSKEDQEKYEESRKVVDDYYAGFMGAYMSGEKKKSLEIARNLLALNMPISQIATATGLTLEQINNLKK